MQLLLFIKNIYRPQFLDLLLLFFFIQSEESIYEPPKKILSFDICNRLIELQNDLLSLMFLSQFHFLKKVTQKVHQQHNLYYKYFCIVAFWVHHTLLIDIFQSFCVLDFWRLIIISLNQSLLSLRYSFTDTVGFYFYHRYFHIQYNCCSKNYLFTSKTIKQLLIILPKINYLLFQKLLFYNNHLLVQKRF